MSLKAFEELEDARREALTERATPNELAGAMLVGLCAHLDAQLTNIAQAKVIFGSRQAAMQIHRGLKEIIAKDRFLYGKLEEFSNRLLGFATAPDSSAEAKVWEW